MIHKILDRFWVIGLIWGTLQLMLVALMFVIAITLATDSRTLVLFRVQIPLAFVVLSSLCVGFFLKDLGESLKAFLTSQAVFALFASITEAMGFKITIGLSSFNSPEALFLVSFLSLSILLGALSSFGGSYLGERISERKKSKDKHLAHFSRAAPETTPASEDKWKEIMLERKKEAEARQKAEQTESKKE